MVVIKWSDAIKGQSVKVDGPQYGGLYKEDNESIIPWSGTDPDAKMNSFTWSWWRHRPQVRLLSAAPMSVPSEEEYLIKYSSGILLTTSNSTEI